MVEEFVHNRVQYLLDLRNVKRLAMEHELGKKRVAQKVKWMITIR